MPAAIETEPLFEITSEMILESSARQEAERLACHAPRIHTCNVCGRQFLWHKDASAMMFPLGTVGNPYEGDFVTCSFPCRIDPAPHMLVWLMANSETEQQAKKAIEMKRRGGTAL